MVLAAITALKKLCNHPKLIYDMITGAKNNDKGNSAAGFESCDQYFTPGMYDVRGGRGGGGMCDGWELHSGKFAVLARLLAILRAEVRETLHVSFIHDSDTCQNPHIKPHPCHGFSRRHHHFHIVWRIANGKKKKKKKNTFM